MTEAIIILLNMRGGCAIQFYSVKVGGPARVPRTKSTFPLVFVVVRHLLLVIHAPFRCRNRGCTSFGAF
jgi:hypothetical protein